MNKSKDRIINFSSRKKTGKRIGQIIWNSFGSIDIGLLYYMEDDIVPYGQKYRENAKLPDY